jgi:uncharacterized protein YqjF (DUF2071 family)
MLNFAVEPRLLAPFVPAGTELDAWEDKTFVSLVGFLFANTRVLGLSIPWHRTFEEVNLRFYVRRRVNGETRRAVVFIRELVPRVAIASVARLAYNEPYRALRMRHEYGAVRPDGIPSSVEYSWHLPSGWSSLRVETTGEGKRVEARSEEEFITEHYWGYTRQRDGSTIEYQVAHPSWRVWAVEAPRIEGELSGLYGRDMAGVFNAPPSSAFLADGSAVQVYTPSRLPQNLPRHQVS